MVSIILSNPQMGENIGAAARAMQNFGLSDLRLVNPRDGWPNERADAMAAGALDRIDIKVFNSLKDAIQDLHFVFATTARQRDMVKPCFTPKSAAQEYYHRKNTGQNIGLAFGAERTGMLNDEISLCQASISIPTNPEFSSLNLGQSVLLMSYAFLQSSLTDKMLDNFKKDDSQPAQMDAVHIFLERLIKDLEDRKFFRAPDLKPTMLRNIQNIFTRADITDQELRTLHGVLSALRGNKKAD